jgi:hypothetical protein
MVLRVRLADGSMERVQVPGGAEDSTTLSDILRPYSDQQECKVRIGSAEEVSLDSTISSLGLKHGSLLTILRRKQQQAAQQPSPTKSHFSKSASRPDHFDPFPELAKDYQSAVRRKQRRRGGMSYNDIAHVQNALHVVEPQNEGPLLRVYICAKSAERFQANGIVHSKEEKQSRVMPRVGLLLGTIQRERVAMKPSKTRTSLSSIPSEMDYCQVAKVHAIWEPNQSPTDYYDINGLIETLKDDGSVLKVASWLGLRPVGWIFSYNDPRLDQEDSLPVWGTDVVHGARIQSKLMQNLGRTDGAQCITLAMDGATGATEAFQLSDVSVQMEAEGIFLVSEKAKAERMIQMKHEILVDGQETKTLDSVLCLVNTALLSHEGSFASSQTLRKNGSSLTKKSKKALLKALNNDDQSSLLNELCDFNVLVALDQLLPASKSEELCRLVHKWARGQRKGTQVEPDLRILLQSLLST